MNQLSSTFKLQMSQGVRQEMYDQMQQYNVSLTKRLNELKTTLQKNVELEVGKMQQKIIEFDKLN